MTALVVFLAAFIGVSDAYFQCTRGANQTRHCQKPLPILEDICLEFSKTANCTITLGAVGGGSSGGKSGGASVDKSGESGSGSGDGKPGGVTADKQNGNSGGNSSGHGDQSGGDAAQCFNNFTKTETLLLACILDLNQLDACNVSAIVKQLVGICHDVDIKPLCNSICLCCGDDDRSVKSCVKQCVDESGIELNSTKSSSKEKCGGGPKSNSSQSAEHGGGHSGPRSNSIEHSGGHPNSTSESKEHQRSGSNTKSESKSQEQAGGGSHSNNSGSKSGSDKSKEHTDGKKKNKSPSKDTSGSSRSKRNSAAW